MNPETFVARLALASALLAVCLACGVQPVEPGWDDAPLPDAGGSQDGGGDPGAGGGPDAGEPDAGTAPPRLVVRLVLIHDVQPPTSRATAEDTVSPLEAAVLDALPARIAQWGLVSQATLQVESRRVNLYTDESGALLAPHLDEPADGTGFPVAGRWRAQLEKKIKQAFPGGEGNLVLVGFGTGGRAAVEVAANVGGLDEVNTQDFGLQDRIAGVVTVNADVAPLQSTAYDFQGTNSYVAGCQSAGYPLGWCEYTGHVNSRPAMSWVAEHRRVLALVSTASCADDWWSSPGDGRVPLRAQASAAAPGLGLAVAPGETLRPAHGERYGDYCHQDVVDPASPRHAAALEEVSTRILDWLFVRAERVANPGSAEQELEVPVLDAATWSQPFTVGGACLAGDVEATRVDVVGTCLHPGTFDGSDHPAEAPDNQVEVTSESACGAAVRWRHQHTGEDHGARLWVKTYGAPPAHSLLSTLPVE